MIAPGQTWRLFYNPGNPHNQTRHVRAIVDGDVVVYRVWSRRKGWRYFAEQMDDAQFLIKRGRMKLVRARASGVRSQSTAVCATQPANPPEVPHAEAQEA